jgi:flagellar motor switch protein FliG
MALGKFIRDGCDYFPRRSYKYLWGFFSKEQPCRFVFLLVFMSVFFSSNHLVKAQGNSISTSESLELRIASLEQKYDSQIISILSNYFDQQKFFVDVDVNANMITETYSTTQNQIVRERPQNLVMPGLPFLPQENLQANSSEEPSTEQIVSENIVRMLQLNSLRIRVYADSSFTDQEIEFMSLIAGIAAKVDESRGDLVTVDQLKMPDFSFSSEVPRIELTQPADDSLMASFESYLPGFILFLLFAFTLLISRFNRPSETDDFYRHLSDRDSIKRDIPTRDNNLELAQPSLPEITSSTSSQLDELAESFFKSPKEIALLFEYWLEEDPENGAHKSAEIVYCIDKHMLKLLRNELDSEKYALIEQELEKVDPISMEEKKERAGKFIGTLHSERKESSAKYKHGQLDLFKFLSHLTAKQVVSLLDGEDRNTSALVIDYLPDDKAAQVFDLLNQDRTAEIMLGMTNLNQLSYQQHKDSSSRLFGKATDIIKVERERTTGSENILPILERLPLKDQRKYIEQLISMGSPVGDVLQNQFLTIEQIPNLDKDLLRDALQSIDTTTLLAASKGFEQQIIETLFSVRPKREQKLLQIELEQNNQLDTRQIELAQKKVMRAIRQTSSNHKKAR